MAFNSFINRSGLIDLPLHGRSFTWYKTNGRCKSRIDRVMRWHNIFQKGPRRTVSYHCPILLEIKTSDWGPKPFRCLNIWFSHPDFGNFVKEKWRSYNVEGWGGFIVKEKLKLLKNDLKEWNSCIFGNLDTAIENHKQVIQELDIIDDIFGLEETEIMKINESVALLLRDLKRKNCLFLQKSRCKWLKEGDLNSHFFHSYINRRRNKNEIVGIELMGNGVKKWQRLNRICSSFSRIASKVRDSLDLFQLMIFL
ncbi:hypothetical protein ACS0TY_006841 [Phlomoides rotata]